MNTAIVTSRNAPAHKRVVTTLRSWGISVDETFFVGGMDKGRILREFKPHLFFDDQMKHPGPAAGTVAVGSCIVWLRKHRAEERWW